MPYGIDAGRITGNAELAQSIELGFGVGRKRPPAITRADRLHRAAPEELTQPTHL